MKKHLSICSIGIFILFTFYSCQKEISNQTMETTLGAKNSVAAAEEGCGEFRTQSPGGWGAPPNGFNPGAYLHENFAAAFPNGLAIGCYPSDFYVQFNSAQAITDFMPAGGKPASLTNNFVDPTGADLGNSLVDHVIALSLTIGFDVYDPNFAPAEFDLGRMVIGTGVFKDMSVNDLLTEANKVLGGCGGTHTAQQLTIALDKVNNNFTDGSVDNGFLICPGPR